MAQTSALLDKEDLLTEIERIKSLYPSAPPIGKTNPEQIERSSGLFANDPLFEAAVRAGQEWRKAESTENEREQNIKDASDVISA